MRGSVQHIMTIMLALLLMVAAFAAIAMFNMKIDSEIKTRMVLRYAVMIAHRLCGERGALVFLDGDDEKVHKNVLDAKKLDEFRKKYYDGGEEIPDDFDVKCYQFYVNVTDYEESKTWEFGLKSKSLRSLEWNETGFTFQADEYVYRLPVIIAYPDEDPVKYNMGLISTYVWKTSPISADIKDCVDSINDATEDLDEMVEVED